jgi:hypothetical protein
MFLQHQTLSSSLAGDHPYTKEWDRLLLSGYMFGGFHHDQAKLWRPYPEGVAAPMFRRSSVSTPTTSIVSNGSLR